VNISAHQAQVPLSEIVSSFPESELFGGKTWRWAPEPYRLDSKLVRELESMGHRLLQFNQACDLLYRQSVQGKQPAWIASLLDRGKPDDVVELGRNEAFKGHTAAVIRPDLILTGEGFSICELDQIPGGIGLTAWLNQTYSALGFDVVGGPKGMLGGFASILPGGEIVVSEEAVTYRPEMEWLAQRLSVSHGESRWRVSDAAVRDSWGGNVYRFFEMFDLENVPCAGGLFRDAVAGKVSVTPPPKAQLEEKLWMALFWMPLLREFWLRQLGERASNPSANGFPTLGSWIRRRSHPTPSIRVLRSRTGGRWRPSARRNVTSSSRSAALTEGPGGRGASVSAPTFLPRNGGGDRSRPRRVPHHPHILQVFCHSVLTDQPFYGEDGTLMTMKGKARLSPYFFVSGGKAILGGVLATVCPADKKILHGMSVAVMAPVAAAE